MPIDQRTFVFSQTYSFDPGASGEIGLFTVPEGETLKCLFLKLYFDIGTEFQLKCKIKYGPRIISPNEGYYSGNGCWVEVMFNEKLYSGDSVALWYENESTTETKRVHVIIEAVRE